MKSAGENHLWERIFVGKDEISRDVNHLWKRILSAGMKSAGKNHLWERIFVVRDEISEGESSLEENFYPQII